jgi:hypothetical protein
MISAGSRQHASAAFLRRRLSTSNDLARRRAALDNRLVGQSPLRDAGSAYRDRSTDLVTPFDRFPNRPSKHLGNRPPAPKSP